MLVHILHWSTDDNNVSFDRLLETHITPPGGHWENQMVSGRPMVAGAALKPSGFSLGVSQWELQELEWGLATELLCWYFWCLFKSGCYSIFPCPVSQQSLSTGGFTCRLLLPLPWYAGLDGANKDHTPKEHPSPQVSVCTLSMLCCLSQTNYFYYYETQIQSYVLSNTSEQNIPESNLSFSSRRSYL
jgi:hypothetical protein